MPALGRPGRAVRFVVAALLLSAVPVVVAAQPARADRVRDAQLWVLNELGLPTAWQVSRGNGVTVAVIDSGVKPDVSDLVGSVITGPDLTGVHTPPSNPHWGVHGTWMASLIAGHGHDGGGSGIIGSAPDSRVLSIRVITDAGDPGNARYQRQAPRKSQHELAEAIRYAVQHGASVISMSLGYSLQSRQVQLALLDAFAHNVFVVASAGNAEYAARAAGRSHAAYSFPADYPGVLGVAAVNAAEQPAGFSSENISVQVAAPGVRVPAQGRDGLYWRVTGTSPACALTAGVAALIKSRYPKISDTELALALTSTTSHRPPGGYNDDVGFGTVNAPAALAAAGRLLSQSHKTGGQQPAADFGGGPAAVPALPVGPRGATTLVLSCLLGAACLALVGVSARWLLRLRLAAAPRPVQAMGEGGGPPGGGLPGGGPPEHGQQGGPASWLAQVPSSARLPWQPGCRAACGWDRPGQPCQPAGRARLSRARLSRARLSRGTLSRAGAPRARPGRASARRASTRSARS